VFSGSSDYMCVWVCVCVHVLLVCEMIRLQCAVSAGDVSVWLISSCHLLSSRICNTLVFWQRKSVLSSI